MCCFGTIFPKNSATGICSNCRQVLKINQLIYLNSNFDLDKIVDEKMDDDEPLKPPKDVKKDLSDQGINLDDINISELIEAFEDGEIDEELVDINAVDDDGNETATVKIYVD